MQIIELSTRQRCEFVDITSHLQKVVAGFSIQRGAAVIMSSHTTAGITVNENWDPDVTADIIATLDRLVPRHGEYAHGEANSDSHIKASLMGLSVTIPVEDGRLALGTWQGVYFCEFDGPRRRQVMVQLLPAV